MNNLEKREKILLYVLVLLLLAVLPFVFVTRGLLDKKSSLGIELDALKIQKQEFLIKEDNFTLTKQKLEAITNEVNKMMADGADVNKTYDVHYAFTDLTRNNNVNLHSLSIGEPTVVEMEGVEVSKDTSMRAPVKLNITMSVEGSVANLLKLVDDINAKGEFFVLESFTLGNIENQNETNAQLGIGLYMILSEEERVQISGI